MVEKNHTPTIILDATIACVKYVQIIMIPIISHLLKWRRMKKVTNENDDERTEPNNATEIWRWVSLQ